MKSKYTLKTQPTDKDPMQVIDSIPDEKKQADAKTLLDIFEKTVGKPPVVWGEKFIGYGTCKYRCASGYSGEIYATGFSVTKRKSRCIFIWTSRNYKAILNGWARPHQAKAVCI